MRQHICRHRSLIQIRSAQSGDLHRHILAALLQSRRAGRRCIRVKLHQHADATAAVHIRHAIALIAGEPAHAQVFADHQHLVPQHIRHGLARLCLGRHERIHIGGVLVDNHLCHLLDKCHKLIALSGKIGLGVDLHHNAHLFGSVHGGICHTFSGDATSFLRLLCQTLFPQIIHGFVHIAVRSLQGFLTIHHTNAGLLTQRHYVFTGKSHIRFLLY